MVGDVVGRPGRRAVKTLLPGLRQEYGIHLVVANAENAAGGFGLTQPTAEELLQAGVDVLTSGNHIWDQKEIIPHLDTDIPLIRPLNYSPGAPGKGYLIKKDVLVVNLVGRTFMGHFDCPFRAIDQLLTEQSRHLVLVDFHAEATSEKIAMGWFLDGRVSTVFGTHTHVGTVDTRLLPHGTAYVTDVGMVGPTDSVIGNQVEAVLHRFLTGLPTRLPVPNGPVTFNSVLVDVDETSGKATNIVRIDRALE